MTTTNLAVNDYAGEIAIIGIACRFPKARNVDEFWRNLRAGVEAFSLLSEEDLRAVGLDDATLGNPSYVRVAALLEDIDLFDARFFGLIPKEAALLDPQQRLFLECAWQAMESAGYNSETYSGRVGVYAGADANRYFIDNVLSHPSLVATLDPYQIMTLTDKDYLCPRTSYHLNLTGPSISIQSACSTALAAVHLATQSLLNGECDMALAGGVSLRIPQTAGYMPVQGGVLSPDGHCRAFDAQAGGTLFGSGVGVVVLKRLGDALADRDHIRAVIKGSAVNNDGASRVGFSAPGVDGQVRVIMEALAMAEINPETVTYVEGHGTGTELGDPIEVSALTRAFRTYTQKKQFCALGSVKTNIGHTSTAAGVAGLIKTVLALEHHEIPPTLHFEEPNPRIDFANSPFYVNAKLIDWQASEVVRRAAVSSFGMGGTNAHLILEEAPALSCPDRPPAHHLLTLSARTATALQEMSDNLVAYLETHSELDLADVAYTLHVGRRAFEQRVAVVSTTTRDAIESLRECHRGHVFVGVAQEIQPPVIFMFPGAGVQHVNMGRDLYEEGGTFHQWLDECSELAMPLLGFDIRRHLYPSPDEELNAVQQLHQPTIGLPALFSVSYALARLWMSWGVHPAALIGHSVGEYVAACLAGVFSLRDAMALIVLRGKLFEQLPEGGMLSVSLPEDQIRRYLGTELAVAAINDPGSCVISGPSTAIFELQQHLTQDRVAHKLIRIKVGAHCKLVDQILGEFTRFVRTLPLSEPTMPYISNVTGTWVTAAQATDPTYWARHLRQTVLFSKGLRELFQDSNRVLLECGPGSTLCSLAKRHVDRPTEQLVVASMRHPDEAKSDRAFLLDTLGKLWISGVQADWNKFHLYDHCSRVPLPPYPFERVRCWIEPGDKKAIRPVSLAKNPNSADWFYMLSWKQAPLCQSLQEERILQSRSSWLLFLDTQGLGASVAKWLEQMGQDVFLVTLAEEFTKLSEQRFAVAPKRADLSRLLDELRRQGKSPEHVVLFWSVTGEKRTLSDTGTFKEHQRTGLYSLLFLVQALHEATLPLPCDITVISDGMQVVTGEEVLCPEKATVLGPCKTIPQEYPGVTCRSIDIDPRSVATRDELLVRHLVKDLLIRPNDLVVAYRGNRRWVQTTEHLPAPSLASPPRRLREEGVYLITGGLGGVGLTLAEYLARTLHARLALLGRSSFPARGDWDRWLVEHDEQNETNQKIRRLQAIENLGSEVLVIEADVADEGQMQSAIQRIDARFGILHGVIHAAGTLGRELERTISEIGYEECERQFRSKVYGVYVLEQVLRNKHLDFCMLMSSISSILGGLGLCAYAAGNLFLDAFVQAHERDASVPWLSVNWDLWRVKESPPEQEQRSSWGATLAGLGMTPEEAVHAWERALAFDDGPQLIVSTTDLQARIDQWVNLRSNKRLAPTDELRSSYQQRPELADMYLAPQTDLDRAVAQIWQQVFGIERIGMQDNFFELGGHSLLGVQLISRLRDELGVELPIRLLFENPTVAGIVMAIHDAERAKVSDAGEAPTIRDFERGKL